MSLNGNLEVFPLEEVLRLLARSRKSGCLRVESGGVQGRIFLTNGSLAMATVASDDELRRRLIASGLVLESDIRKIELSGSPVSQSLAPEVNPSEFSDFVREESTEGLYRIKRSGRGTFDFLVELAPRYPSGQSFDAEVVVSEADRRALEWEDIESVLPSMSQPLRMVATLEGEDTVTLSPSTWRILAALGGGASTQVVADHIGWSEFRTAREMASLVRNRLVELFEPETVTAPVAAPEVEADSDAAAEPEPVDEAQAAAEAGAESVIDSHTEEAVTEEAVTEEAVTEEAVTEEAVTEVSVEEAVVEVAAEEVVAEEMVSDQAEAVGDADVEAEVEEVAVVQPEAELPSEPAAEPEPEHAEPEVGTDAVLVAAAALDEVEIEPVGDEVTAELAEAIGADEPESSGSSWWTDAQTDSSDNGSDVDAPWSASPWTAEQPTEEPVIQTSPWGGPAGVENVAETGVEVEELAPEDDAPTGDADRTGGWWAETMGGAAEKTSDSDADKFLESVFSSLSEDEPEGAKDEDETGFGMGLLRRRRMGAAARDISDNDR
ncbi:MAG: DUF4388 domain-containing protein [Acidimicrobiia bacterium]|nr:DUF4388 domain-containing protein [Acidimicrobiia bacterium]